MTVIRSWFSILRVIESPRPPCTWSDRALLLRRRDTSISFSRNDVTHRPTINPQRRRSCAPDDRRKPPQRGKNRRTGDPDRRSDVTSSPVSNAKCHQMTELLLATTLKSLLQQNRRSGHSPTALSSEQSVAELVVEAEAEDIVTELRMRSDCTSSRRQTVWIDKRGSQSKRCRRIEGP